MQKTKLPPADLYTAVERQIQCEADGIHTNRAEYISGRRSMRDSLAQSEYGIIAEFKRRSPSKGWIKEEARPDCIPHDYAVAGASAVSILTDEKFFGGSLDFIRIARPTVPVPILRKDFIIDEYQLFQARQAGADAVLLIAAVLSETECRQLIQTAHRLALEVLLEIHDESELTYTDSAADMIGVNNRHLGSFHTDAEHSLLLAGKLPRNKLLVSESGISCPQTVRTLRQAGYQGFLMGEYFMRAADPGTALKEFIAELEA